jgi:hypothetical protein
MPGAGIHWFRSLRSVPACLFACLVVCLFACVYVCRQVWIALGPSAALGSQPWETPFGEVTAADLDVLDGTDAVDRPLRFAGAPVGRCAMSVSARAAAVLVRPICMYVVCVLLP